MQGHQPGLLTQFDCSENRATMHGGGRDYGRCLHLTLRWFECGNPNLPERQRSPPMESTPHCGYTSSTRITLTSLTLVRVGPVSRRSPVAAKKAVASLLSR